MVTLNVFRGFPPVVVWVVWSFSRGSFLGWGGGMSPGWSVGPGIHQHVCPAWGARQPMAKSEGSWRHSTWQGGHSTAGWDRKLTGHPWSCPGAWVANQDPVPGGGGRQGVQNVLGELVTRVLKGKTHRGTSVIAR